MGVVGLRVLMGSFLGRYEHDFRVSVGFSQAFTSACSCLGFKGSACFRSRVPFGFWGVLFLFRPPTSHRNERLNFQITTQP